MQVLITHGHLAKTRVLFFSRAQLIAAAALLVLLLTLLSGTVYHVVFLQAARDGWPVVSQIVRWVVRDEIAQRERFMRENLDAMAERVGEMQAKLVKLESMGDRVSGLVGVKVEGLKAQPVASGGGRGGPYVPLRRPSLTQLGAAIDGLDEAAEQNLDLLTLIESRLLESRLQSLMVPNSRPVDGPVGSGFGFRTDPFSGRAALHTGLDFPAEIGTPVEAAAGGVVAVLERHPQYGLQIEMDHGNGLTTRYAHLFRANVKIGDIVDRGRTIGQVGSSGRSTGPHLHFEVLLQGVPQNPAKFLAGGPALPVVAQGAAQR
jgi:murein DD-endopeptidase MepM/ murein hydrolase activator NlpD